MDTKTSQTLSPSSSGRRRIGSNACSSPEFEFWMVRNPSLPQPNILSADELFVDGVLLPLHLLSTQKPDPSLKTLHPNPETPNSEPPPPAPDPEPEPESFAAITDSDTTTFSSSKRWKDIFKKSDKKNAHENNKEKEKGKKKERKGVATTSAELNINIWPFSRSRSAGNAGTRPKWFAGAPVTRKVNSAPCSRSNSAGESKSRKWPSSPGRVGVHLGRSSPVWQVRRAKNPEPLPPNPDNHKGSKREIPTTRRSKISGTGDGSDGGKARVLNLNVPICIGYGQNMSCRSHNNSANGVSDDSNIRGSNNDRANVGGKLFNIRSLFTKKSIVV